MIHGRGHEDVVRRSSGSSRDKLVPRYIMGGVGEVTYGWFARGVVFLQVLYLVLLLLEGRTQYRLYGVSDLGHGDI